ncbi:MAG: sulfatase [Spirochaetales bacterium]|nr:sulfatase [Spirochaetales bacterium]
MVNRVLKYTALMLILLLVLSLASCGRTGAEEKNLKNIIVITADDLGWRDLSSYGSPDVPTPNIDSLADEGFLFDQCYAVSPSCAPSRASLITGQYPHTHGVDGLVHIHPEKTLSPFHFTLPRILRRAGYETAIHGKWHVAPFFPKSWYGYKTSLNPINPFAMHIESSDPAVDYINNHADEPFYLELNYMNNHRRDDGTFENIAEYAPDPGAISVPSYYALPDMPEILSDLADYHSQTMKMDKMIGDVLGALKRNGLTDNTIIVFFSDNGAPYPGMKMTLYERGTKVPMIVKIPGTESAGSVVDEPVNSIDIMPTILDALSLDIPREVQGESLMPLLEGNRPENPDKAVFTEMTYHVGYIPGRAVRQGSWKYIRNYSSGNIGLDQLNYFEWAHRLCDSSGQPWKSPRIPEELYDLDSDPDEQNNVINLYPEKAAGLSGLLDEHMAATGDAYLEKSFEDDYDAGDYVMTEYKPSWWSRKDSVSQEE